MRPAENPQVSFTAAKAREICARRDSRLPVIPTDIRIRPGDSPMAS